MKAKEALSMHGRLTVFKDYKTENGVTRIRHFEEDNVITLLAKQHVLAGLYLSNTSDPIVSLQIGTGGDLDPSGLYPKPVTQNLTSLYNYYGTIPVTYTISPTVPSVTFVADVDEGTGNGQSINEAGLYTLAGVLFNIKTFPSVSKTSDFSLHFSWTIDLA